MTTTSSPGAPDTTPAYLELGLDEVQRRARRAVEGLADCRFCPRDCGVNRLEDRWSACKTGRHAIVGSHFPHFGEEDCLRGWNGSGTIFFSHCNLRCVFCQNHSISQDIKPHRAPEGATAEQIADMALELQRKGCHNINFVTPEHVVPQVLEAIAAAAERGLIVRHLVMPGMVDETRGILDWVGRELGPETYVNLMDQYYPDADVAEGERYEEIDRGLRSEEFREAKRFAREAGVRLDRRRPLSHPGDGRTTLPTH